MIFDGEVYRNFTPEEQQYFDSERKRQEEWDKMHLSGSSSEERITQLEEELAATKILLGLEAQ